MPLKILLADDSMIAQNMGKKILTEAGYEVTTVSNGAAAVKRFPELRPDIVLLDVYMPGYSGLEISEQIKGSPATAHVPILLTVGKLEPFRAEDGIKAKADGVIVKPFEATDLITVVGKLAQRVRAFPPAFQPQAAPKADAQPQKAKEPAPAAEVAAEPVQPTVPTEPAAAPALGEDLLHSLAFSAIDPVRKPPAELPPEPDPELPPPQAGTRLAGSPERISAFPAEIQAGVAALDLSSIELLPAISDGQPAAADLQPLEIHFEPAMGETEFQSVTEAAAPQPPASIPEWYAEPPPPAQAAPSLPELERFTDPVLTSDVHSATPAPPIFVEQPAGTHDVSVSDTPAAPQNAERGTALPPPAGPDEVPEFAFFASVFGSSQDGQFDARLAAAMDAVDAAASVPEPRPMPAAPVPQPQVRAPETLPASVMQPAQDEIKGPGFRSTSFVETTLAKVEALQGPTPVVPLVAPAFRSEPAPSEVAAGEDILEFADRSSSSGQAVSPAAAPQTQASEFWSFPALEIQPAQVKTPERRQPTAPPDSAATSFEIDLRQLLGDEAEGEPPPVAATMTPAAPTVPAAANFQTPAVETAPAIPPAAATPFEQDVDRVLRDAVSSETSAKSAAAFSEEAAAPEEFPVSSDHLETAVTEALPKVAGEPPVAAHWHSEGEQAAQESYFAEREHVFQPAEKSKTEAAGAEAEFASQLDIVNAQPASPEPTPAGTDSRVAEEIVDRVLQRLRSELVEEVKRALAKG